MNFNDYISRNKSFYITFLSYIDSDTDTHENFQELITFINTYKYGESKDELRTILHIIQKISNHHKRQPGFISKIHRIILFFSDKAKQTFSNYEIFRIFRKNKLLLVFLFENKIITVDEPIVYYLIEKNGPQNSNFFYPEIKPFLNKEGKRGKITLTVNPKVFEDDYEKNRLEGENESYICQLIRNDSIDDFIQFVNDQKINLSSSILTSLFETNPYILKNKIVLIEYAAFFGSFKIFKYLFDCKVGLPSSLWFCAIHGQNYDIINLLDENNIEPEDLTYKSYYNESIKCHHNDIANFFQSEFIANEEEEEDENNFVENCFINYNFEFIPNELTLNIESILELACQYDYVSIVKILLETNKIDLKNFLLRKDILKKNKFFFIYKIFYSIF